MLVALKSQIQSVSDIQNSLTVPPSVQFTDGLFSQFETFETEL